MEDADKQMRLRRALAFLRPCRFTIGGILGLTLMLAALNALEPLILKYLFDGLGKGAEDGRRALIYSIIGLGALTGLREGTGAVTNWLTWRTRLGLNYSLLGATVEKLQNLSLSFHSQKSVGGIMTRLDRGIQGFLGAVCEMAFDVIPALIYLCISIFIMVRMDWRLAGVVLLFAPAPILITAAAAPECTKRERTLLEFWARIYSRFNEVLSGIATVKSFAMERRETKRFLQDVQKANNVVIRGVGVDCRTGAARNLVVAVAKMTSLGVGALLILRGEITVGTLIAFLGYVGGLFGPVQGLSSIYRTLHTASVSLETIFSIMDAKDQLADAPDARVPGPLQGEVRFERVRFAYEPSGRPVLDGIDILVNPGETVALVGPSGAGKTTMMALLQRFYDPVEGVVRVDGIDLRTLKQQALRRQVGVVLQDTLLFNDTVLNNIRYGRLDAPTEEVMEAVQAANAHDFIVRLPQGYNTPVGERGNLLSAGERQRIAIARALLKNPSILILDEPTSALDAETEALVQEAIARLSKGRTTFIIAHRLSTIVSADRIVVLKDGRLVEQGTHTELMEKGGYYASLVWKQSRGLVSAGTCASTAGSKLYEIKPRFACGPGLGRPVSLSGVEREPAS